MQTNFLLFQVEASKSQASEIASPFSKFCDDSSLDLRPDAISPHEIPKFHYAVETDTDENWFEKIVQWYDEEHMLGSPPRLAVRHTAWSDIARPHFKNTLRTMMEII